MTLEMSEFSRPLSLFASRFVEQWQFNGAGEKTAIRRSIELHHKSFIGWLVLGAISRFLKKAVDRHLRSLAEA
jgi:hypothetical protein